MRRGRRTADVVAQAGNDTPAPLPAAPPAAGSPLPPLAATAGNAAAIASGAAVASGPRAMLQAGAFFDEANARGLVTRLARAGIGNAVVRATRAGTRMVWQVRVGPLDGTLQLDDMLERLRLAGVPDARRVFD